MGHGKKTDEQAIVALLANESQAAAAEAAGVSRSTLSRWLRNPDFQRRLREARDISHGHALARLCELANKAVTVLGDALDGVDIPKSQFLAARTVLDVAQQAHNVDVENRIAEIEQQINQMENAK